MINLHIDKAFEQVIDQASLEQAAVQTLAYTGTSPQAGLTVVIGGDAQIQALNRQYRDQDQPTDVLSFPFGEVDPDDGQVYLGDVVISFPQVLRQAKEGKHTAIAELRLMVVHGVLHLLGFDHAVQTDREAMWKAQAEILTRLGNPVTRPGRDE